MSKAKKDAEQTALAAPVQRGTIDLGISFSLPAGVVPGALEGALLTQLYHEAQDATLRVLRFGWAALKIKDSLEHGQFGPWLKEHCPGMPERTVQHYMKLTRTTLPEWQEVEDFGNVDAGQFAGKTMTALLAAASPAHPAPAKGGAEQGGVKPPKKDGTGLAEAAMASLEQHAAGMAGTLAGALDLLSTEQLDRAAGLLSELAALVRGEQSNRG